MAKKEVLHQATNDAAATIALEEPYIAEARLVGTAPYLFHRWSVEDVEAKANAKKGSKAKKTDNVESYVYRTESGELAIPGEAVRQSIVHAAKFRQDPRSPRKSAMDLFKAGVVALTDLAPLGVKDWDMIDKRRVVLQRNAITRCRPCMRAGWTIDVQLQVLTPEYIDVDVLHEVLAQSGRLIGVGDFRPTFGRFRVEHFRRLELKDAAE